MGRDHDLLEAARTGNLSVVEKILAPKKKQGLLESLRRPNPNCQDSSGYTPLHHAVLNNHSDIVLYLVSHDANPNIADNKGLTPVHLASWSGNAGIVKILLSTQKIKVNEANCDGETALHFAAQYGHKEVVTLLLEKHSRAANRNKNLQTPLDLSALYGRLETVQLLLQEYPGLLESSPPNHTPLHLAARNGHVQVVIVLLDAGADINSKSNSGTALHEAALYGKVEVVKVLMEHGIDTKCQNNDNKTALDIVEELNMSQKSQEIAALIKGIKKPSPIEVPGEKAESERSEICKTPYDNVSSPDYQSMSGSSPESSPLSSPTAEMGYQNLHPFRTPPQKPARYSGARHSTANITPETANTVERKRTSSVPSSEQAKNGKIKSFAQEDLIKFETDEEDLIKFEPEEPTYDEIPSPTDKHFEAKDTSNIIQVPAMKTEAAFKDNSSSKPSNNGSSSMPSSGGPITSNVTGLRKRTESIESNPGPPLPDRNYYDEDIAGTYARLRDSADIDTVIKKDGENTETALSPVTPDPTKTPEGESIYELLSDATSGGHDPTSPTSSEGSVTVQDMALRKKPAKPTKPSHLPLKNGNPPSPMNNNVDKSPQQGFFDATSDSQRSSMATDITESSECCSTSETESDEHAEFIVTATVTKGEPSKPEQRINSLHLSTISEGTEDRVSMETVPSDKMKDEVFVETHVKVARGPSDKTSDMISVSTDSSSEGEILRPEGLDPFAGLVYGSGQNRTPPPVNFDLSPLDSPLKAFSPVDMSQVSHSTESLESPDFDRILKEAEESKIAMTTREGGGGGGVGGGGSQRDDSVFLDESKEWQQVSDILSSIGAAMVRESVYSRDLEDQFQRMMKASVKPENVGQWLEKLGLPQYQHIFLTHGYDDLNFLNGKVLEEQDLLDMGLMERNHRQLILESAKLLPSYKPPDEDKRPSTVEEWLQSIHLSDYATRFHKMGFSTMERVHNIWEVELTNVLEISTIGHRKRILVSLGERSAPKRTASTSSTEGRGRPLSFTLSKDFTVDWDISPVEENGASANDSEDKSSQGSSSLENINLFRDYSKLKPSQDSSSKSSHSYENVPVLSKAASSKQSVPSRNSRKHQPSPYENVPIDPLANKPFSLDPGNWSEDGVPIRSPQIAHSDRPLSMSAWKHDPDKLIKSFCNYEAAYLGSQLIKELKGTESTREACAKLRKSTKNMQKMPIILLSMNYKGVKFIDAVTKMVITDHSIKNISCAAQDPADLKTFAYITRDSKVNKHYCHVFSVATSELAAEVILTLGQAFEVAYQMLVKEKSGDVNPLYKAADINPLYQPQDS
ncbi:ankyrin repeat and SAM domain-containing protein 1A-like isoform X2 [Glandiceps talaboti]